jgi:putative oxidoreductase
MKKLLSVKYSAGAFNTAMLLVRLAVGILMMQAGYYKLTHFSELTPQFMNFMGLGSTTSLALVVFAEFFCSMFVILGLFTRFAVIPLIIVVCVIIFKVDHGDMLHKSQFPTLLLTGYLTLLLVGPGRVSVDSMIGK